MSLKTWKKEFYPKSAKRTKISEAVEHSLQKWRGILPDNLKKHGLERDINRIDEVAPPADRYGSLYLRPYVNNRPDFRLDDETCSLCVWYYNDDASDECSSCATCPLFKATGKSCADGESLYSEAIYDGKVNRMVKALAKARNFV